MNVFRTRLSIVRAILLVIVILFTSSISLAQDRGCSISEFWISHHGKVELGTNVEISVASSCGTSKITINGEDRAEIGLGNTFELMKTSEWGPGVYEICGVVRGKGGWQNAESVCDTIVVLTKAEAQSVEPDNHASDYSCGTWIPVEPGNRARITAGDANRLRSGPGTNFELVGSLPGLTEFFVMSGPYCEDGYTWIELRTDRGWHGYTPVGTPGTPWVEAIPSHVEELPGSNNSNDDQSITELNLWYEPFEFEYTFKLNNSCEIVNGAEVVAQEIERSAYAIREDGNPLATAIWFFTPKVGPADEWRKWVDRTMKSQAGCAKIYYVIGGKRMDTSGIQNINYGFYTVILPSWAAHLSGDIAAFVHLRFGDEPDDKAQMDVGRIIAEDLGQFASPSPDYVDMVAKEYLVASP